jgi:flagellar hook-associated protein 3 FlgL
MIATLADGTKSPDDLRNYATELSQLIKQTVQLANSKHRGSYLFAGTLTDAPPFQATTNAAGDVTAVNYAGNTNVLEGEVAEGVTVSPFVVGANSTGAGPRGLLVDSSVGADLFGHLISLHNNLLSGNTTAIRDTDRPNLNRDEDNFLYQIGTNGSVQARLESAAAISKQRGESIERLVSSETDADLAQTVVRLTEAQTAYRAALQSSATMLNQSLLDYLR